MVDKNGTPLKDGDFIDITCPFCGWTYGGGRFARIRNLKLSRKENEYSGTNRDQAT